MKRICRVGCLSLVVISLCFLLATAFGTEPTSTETADFREVQQTAIALGKKYHPENVLLVFDIDNTLLAMKQDLGSVQWFRWQEELLKKEEPSADLVANDFDGLLRAQGLLFATGQMRLTQPELPAIIGELQQTGFSTLLLTSRGYTFRDSTRQALQDNGFDFAISALTPVEAKPGPYLPYELTNLAAEGITAEEAAAWGIKKPKPVCYAEGVYLTAGQHKGIMLRTLLHHTDSQPKAIVFVDDTPKHILEMKQTFGRRPVELHLFHLTLEDDWSHSFENSASRKRKATAQWQRLLQALPDFEPAEALKLQE